MMTMEALKLEFWDSFNEELYCNYLIQKDERMNTQRKEQNKHGNQIENRKRNEAKQSGSGGAPA